jgi:tripartite-type tricarboxylate transporter receptor subunit TctC
VHPGTALATAALIFLATGPLAAQPWPVKPVRLVLPFAPGGSTDTLVRILGPRLGEALGQTAIVDNRGGGGGNIAAEIVARSAPDGYTILVGSAMLTTNKHLYSKLGYDPERDFLPVTHLAMGPYILMVHPSLPVRTVGDLIALARSKPRTLHFGSSGNGGASHLAGELFKRRAGIDIVHVPYKGGGPAALAVMGGEIPFLFGTIASSLTQVQAGKLRAIAVSSLKRSGLVPDLPTMDEAGVRGFDVTTWDGLVAPAGTPQAIIERLGAETVKVLRMPDIRERIVRMGYEPTGTTPEDFGRFLRDESDLWAKVIREGNIRIE